MAKHDPDVDMINPLRLFAVGTFAYMFWLAYQGHKERQAAAALANPPPS